MPPFDLMAGRRGERIAQAVHLDVQASAVNGRRMRDKTYTVARRADSRVRSSVALEICSPMPGVLPDCLAWGHLNEPLPDHSKFSTVIVRSSCVAGSRREASGTHDDSAGAGGAVGQSVPGDLTDARPWWGAACNTGNATSSPPGID